MIDLEGKGSTWKGRARTPHSFGEILLGLIAAACLSGAMTVALSGLTGLTL